MKQNKFKSFAVANVVPILFISLSAIGVYFSGVAMPFIINDVVARFDRNAFLVLSLIIPVLAGMGLNFGIVVGAMSGQIALFIVTVMGIEGVTGLLVAAVLTLPFSLLFGWLTANVLNKTKGQEMITSLILGFFSMGVYQFVFLFAIGGIIKIDAPGIIMSDGVGVRNNIDLVGVKYGLDNVYKCNPFTFLIIVATVWLVFVAISALKEKKLDKKNVISLAVIVGLYALGMFGNYSSALTVYRNVIKIPVASFAVIWMLCLFMKFFFSTKLGQDMRATGQSMEISEVAGINVNKTRTTATIMSIILAGWGQIIFLQNMGNISTYNAHENVGMFSAAALLIGGASIVKATVPQALVGTILFHILFNVSPMAGQRLFGSPTIGEYFRVFIAYGVIAVTLALHAWKQVMAKNAANRAADEADDKAKANAAGS